MTNLLKHAAAWDNENIPWTEEELQMAICQDLRRRRVHHAADMNAGRRSLQRGARLKLAGMTAGEPDLRLYLPGGLVVFVELKRKGGVVSREQKDRHEVLRGLGFHVHVLKAHCPAQAVAQIVDILAMHGHT